MAIFQSDIKRMLAYSSVAQIGYMVLGLSLASLPGLTGGIVHLFNHALMKSGLFLVMACVLLRTGSTKLEAMHGLGRKMPLDHGGVRARRPQPGRGARHRGLRQQVVSWCKGALEAGCWPWRCWSC